MGELALRKLGRKIKTETEVLYGITTGAGGDSVRSTFWLSKTGYTYLENLFVISSTINVCTSTNQKSINVPDIMGNFAQVGDTLVGYGISSLTDQRYLQIITVLYIG